MIQESYEEGGFQNFHRQLRRRLSSLLLCKLQEQAKSVAIACDGWYWDLLVFDASSDR
jgi:hypothetical protein